VTKERTQERDACPKQEFNKWRVVDDDQDGVAADTVKGRWRGESSNRHPILFVDLEHHNLDYKNATLNEVHKVYQHF
jgi:hypothetical protein